MQNKAAAGAGTIRKKTVTRNGKEYTYWEGRLTVGTDGNGRQAQRSFSGKTQKEVREKMQAAAVELNEGSYLAPTKMSVAQWLDIWTAEYLGGVKYRTAKHYKAQVETHIKPALGAIKLNDLKAPQIQAFYNALGKSGKLVSKKDAKTEKVITTYEPLAPKSIRNIHGILTKALSTAVNVEYLKRNPAERVTLPRAERKEIHPLESEQVAAYFREAGKDEYGNLLRVLPFTGLRESEALGLTWDCIDFDKGVLTVKQQLLSRRIADGGYTLSDTKNGKIRTIKLAPAVVQIFKDQQRKQIEDRLQAAEAWEGWQNEKQRKTAFVFTTPEGRNLVPRTLIKHAKKIFERIGVEDRCVHDLRHTFAMLSLQNGDDYKTVQENMGHATAAFTLDVYGHCSDAMRDNSAARMQSFIDANIEQAM